jgi:hypothetical protein
MTTFPESGETDQEPGTVEQPLAVPLARLREESSPGAGRYQRRLGSELDIPVGTRMQLSPAASERRFTAEYVGALGYEHLLLRFPAQGGAREVLVNEAAVSVRFLHLDYNVCGFSTVVAGATVSPLPLLLLAFPEFFGTLELRRHRRASCFLPAHLGEAGAPGRALISNLSPGGCRVVLEAGGRETRQRLAAGAGLALSFRLFDALDEVFAPGVVRTVESLPGRLALGVQFAGLKPGDAEKIEEYVEDVRRCLGN